jgi:4'-phosphopantetheinyl transferase
MVEHILQAFWVELDPLATRCRELCLHLNPEETDRAVRFRAERDRLHYIARHGWLRERLAARLGAAPSAIPIVCDSFGKPRIPGDPVSFSLSHSYGVALLVIGTFGAVGCDIEWRDPDLDVLAVAKQFFSLKEYATLASLAPVPRREGFFHAWTRKEAYTKAVGRGLSIPLDSFEVALDPGQPPALLRGCDGWTVAAFEPHPGFQAAVVAPGEWRLMQGPV